ncbi:hypothetical protein GCM10009617_07840 [Leifsonia poae]|uniref:Uncharacterized protein n=2 Tax=Leifsonia poae TaxID=110933 RepID=A0A9W6H8A9_9MICO|nr:hypothetical protein GCM10017584_08830 [Leifsonia poae]
MRLATLKGASVSDPSQATRPHDEYVIRKLRLSPDHRAAVDAVERYLVHRGAFTDAGHLERLLNDLVDLFEQSAWNNVPIREIVGEDPVEFAEQLLANYADGQSIAEQRNRLTATIDEIIAGVVVRSRHDLRNPDALP